MNRKVLATIEQYSMLEQGDTVIVAISGGADSVALLDLLCMLPGLRLTVRACHLNHCLRGAESDRDERLVRTICREYGVPLDLRRVEIQPLARARKRSVEETARDERYAFFEELAAKYGGKVATGHTLSDTAETVVFHLARGTGMTGLCGIPTVRGRMIRPLLACARAETEGYCHSHGLYFVNDSSNLDDRYTRNFIRHAIIPALLQVNDGALGAIGRMTELMRIDAEYLAGAAGAAAQECAREGGLDAARLWGLHPAVRGRVIGLLLEAQGISRSSQRIAQVEQLLRGTGARAVSAGRGVSIRVRGGVLLVERTAPGGTIQPQKYAKEELAKRPVLVDERKTLLFFKRNCEEYEIFKNNADWDLKNLADYDKMKNDLFIRARKAGDRIRQPGRGCSKTLKKLLCELALPDRDRLCVVADEAGVIFCEAVGIDERIAPDAHTKRLVLFQIMEEQTK